MNNVVDSTEVNGGICAVAEGRSIIDDIMDENSVGCHQDDEITRLLHQTAVGDKSADPLMWWKLSAVQFPNIGRIVREILAIQASYVESKNVFYTAGQTVDPHRSFLSDASIWVCMLLNSWNRVGRQQNFKGFQLPPRRTGEVMIVI